MMMMMWYHDLNQETCNEEKVYTASKEQFKKYVQNRTDSSNAADNVVTQFESFNLQRRKNILNKLIL